MAAKEKRESQVSPVLIKFGVALAFSLGGIVVTFLRIKPSKPKLSMNSPGEGSETDSRRVCNGDLSQTASALQNDISRDRDGVLLAEVDHLISNHSMDEHEECNLEIKNLSNKVKTLEERERILEMQLLEYYGLEEQETAVIELQNRLRIHNMEAKLYNLKLESLQSENRKLGAQVADYKKAVTELESAKAKINSLRKKLKSDAEQNREHILSLQEKVMKLKDEENKAVEIHGDLEMEIKKMNKLELELEEMKKTNESLKIEHFVLARKLEDVQMRSSSDLNGKEMQALKEESHLLRHQNQDLTKEIEKLRANQCMDIEELVYLRWINACLRYEMRNFHPGPGETIARDLSKTLSPESEQKAKQLIVEYANREGSGDHEMNITEFYSDQWSTSRASHEYEDFRIDKNKTNKRKFFAKLMRLLRRKDGHELIHTQSSAFERASSVDEVDLRGYFGSFGADGVVEILKTSPRGSSAHSVDLQRPCSQGQKSTTGESSRGSDDDSFSTFRELDSVTGFDSNLSTCILPHDDAQSGTKRELLKYAGVLKKSLVESSSPRRRSASHCSF